MICSNVHFKKRAEDKVNHSSLKPGSGRIYVEFIYNYNKPESPYLELNIGDSVNICEENSDWYHGCLARNRSMNGIFPKAYVQIRPAVIDKTGPHEIIIAREPPIVQEISSVLREWGTIWKQLYINNVQVEFETIQRMAYELINWRKQIMSGTLPVDELKDLKQKITAKIDMGNALLGLDLVVRDEQGNILNPDVTSTIHLYRQHEIATQRIQRERVQRDTRSKRSSSHFSHSLFVTVKNFVCRIGEDADVLMTLYDSRENKFISENYLVKWAKEGLARDLDQLNNLHVLFTDLGSKDLIREKVFLVCQIIRIGEYPSSMELKEPIEQKRSTVYSKKISDGIRRPFGVAVMDVSDIINGSVDYDEDKQHFVPFLQCGERDFLENVIRKMISVKDMSQKEHKGQGLWICVKLLPGDWKQCKEENPHIFTSNTSIACKMGFPEIILPGDIRNDLYLTLIQGEYSRGSSKSSERNVEVNVTNAISIGAGSDDMNSYKSVVYYHEDKPKWFETLKITIPIEDFYNSHLRFTFKHRSSNEGKNVNAHRAAKHAAKDKAEKIFALSYVNLMLENGTTLIDYQHELLVYKIDHKKWDENSVSYLTLPSTKPELMHMHNNSQTSMSSMGTLKHGSFQHAGLSLSTKDSFVISTLVCSTKFTANVDLLGLLKWRINPDNLELTLLSLMKVDGEEVVKFLQDTLDAMFNILMQNSESDLYDNLVFEALIFIISLISDRKYQHFRPVLDMYIEENFSATLADNKLMIVLKHYIDNASCKEGTDLLLRIMKSLEYIMKFIVRSRLLYAALNEGKGRQQFEMSLKKLMQSISGMMLYTTDTTLLVQGACMKYLPYILSDTLKAFEAKELSYLMTDFINNVPVDRLTKQKMMCINDIVHSDLFKKPECRSILLPVINDHVKLLLERSEEEELCIKILGDIMIVLNSKDVVSVNSPYGSTENDISDIMLSMLRTIIQCVIHMKRNSQLIGYIVAVMIDVLRQMTSSHYEQYIKHFRTKTDLIDFLIELLMVFNDLVNNNVYPLDWNEMIMLQNNIILKTLRFISHTVRDGFSNPFELQVWDNFFNCATAFLTQGPLQLENFSQNKRSIIISRYKDMRRETGFEIRSMWFNLGRHKINFVPGMVGSFLEMTLIPEVELRKATIPIFFDMMQIEFYADRHSLNSSHLSTISIQSESDHHHVRDIKGNFSDFENAMITQLDVLFEGGRGDEQYKDLFFEMQVSILSF
ncbi:Dedicator of cytokinesis protein 1 [Nymphon striatum]|nr:Dedicator of cytokinesis protein 1 [Nymphon striatum]